MKGIRQNFACGAESEGKKHPIFACGARDKRLLEGSPGSFEPLAFTWCSRHLISASLTSHHPTHIAAVRMSFHRSVSHLTNVIIHRFHYNNIHFLMSSCHEANGSSWNRSSPIPSEARDDSFDFNSMPVASILLV
eukprot:gene7061-biopygen13975